METCVRKTTCEANRTFRIELPGISSPSKSTTQRHVNKFRTMGPLLNKKRQKTRDLFFRINLRRYYTAIRNNSTKLSAVSRQTNAKSI